MEFIQEKLLFTLMALSEPSWMIAALGLICFAFATSCDARARRAAVNEDSRRMKLEFQRSGGFAAIPGLAVHGRVELNDKSGVVRIEGLPDRRMDDLTFQRLRAILSSIDPVSVPSDLRVLSRPSASLADQFQYDIRVTLQNGRTFHTIAGEQEDANVLNTAAPGIGDLVQWIRHQAETSSKERLTAR